MVLLQSDKIKLKILNTLYQSTNPITLNGLRKRIGAINYISVKRSCHFLELFGLIKVEEKPIEGRKYYFITITQRGSKILELTKNVATKLK